MKEFIKKNFAILIAFALPVIIILVVALATYIPTHSVSTKYNFIYVACADGSTYYYECNNYLQKRYSVVDGKLVANTIDPEQDLNYNHIPDIKENYNARIFLHDTEKNESREITIEEAQSLKLSSLLTSPDGVTVSGNYNYNGGGDFFIFGGGGYSSFGYYLSKGDAHTKLNLINSGDNRYYYQNNFQLLGWILPGRN